MSAFFPARTGGHNVRAGHTVCRAICILVESTGKFHFCKEHLRSGVKSVFG